MRTVDILKRIIVEDLNMEEFSPADIDDNAPLFGEGFGLDSLDAVELVVLVQKHFGLEIKNMEEARSAFQSVNALAAYIDGRLVA